MFIVLMIINYLCISLGNIRQPKWGHLKELHASVKLMEKALTYGEVVEDHLGNGLTV